MSTEFQFKKTILAFGVNSTYTPIIVVWKKIPSKIELKLWYYKRTKNIQFFDRHRAEQSSERLEKIQ